MKKLILMILSIFILTGCGNRDIWDTNHTFDYAECYLNGEYQKYEIKKCTDYEGEQIQIVAKDGKTYLISMNYCRLVKND